MDDSNVFRALSAEWGQITATSSSRRALRRWQERCPELAKYRTLDDLVAACRGTEPATGNRLLASLVAMRDTESLATRVALQALLPGLWKLASRLSTASRLVGRGRPWPTRADLEFEIVALASGRLAGPTVVGSAWPAVRVLDGVRDDLRTSHRASVRATLDFGELDEDWPVEGDGRTAADRVTSLLVQAVAAGIVKQRDASALYTTRVLGHPTADVAAVVLYDVDTLRQRRCRAIRRLARAVALGELAVAS
jgi:hypothetical protein